MTRRWFRLGFAQASGAGRFGSFGATLGAGSAIQLLGAVAGFVTVPILVSALGGPSFGVLVVIASLGPWLTLVDGALHPATRLLVGESREDGRVAVPRGLLHSAIRLAAKVAAANMATLTLALVGLPLVALFGSEGVADHRDLVVAVMAFAVPVIVSSPGAVYLGALEGSGRTVIASIHSGMGPLLALPLSLLVAEMGGGLPWLCAVQGSAVALSRFSAWAYWHLRPSPPASSDQPHTRLRFSLVSQMLLLSAAYLVQSGLDPAIVSSNLGAEAAGSFGLANRIVLGALIPLVVLTPLFAANLAAARRGGWSEDRSSELRHLVMQAGMAGLFVGGCVAALGPPVARLLGGGEVPAPLSLYFAGALYVFAAFLSTPLLLAFSGPQGLARAVRLSVVQATGNVGLSLVLVNHLGPSGPLWASAAAGLAGTTYFFVMWARHPEWLGETHDVSPSNAQSSLD